MACFRTLWIVLLAVVVGTQGVAATLAMSICCCAPEQASNAESQAKPQCPKCAQVAEHQTQQASQSDRCCLKRVCECSKERVAESVVTRRIVDENSLELRHLPVVQFVPTVNGQSISQNQPLLLVQTIHLKNCVWLL